MLNLFQHLQINMISKKYYIYILASRIRGPLYIGVTNNLLKRIWQHKEKIVEGFTTQYQVNRLVYYEEYTDIREAIAREKQLKNWHRQWKINIIEQQNSGWKDLYFGFGDPETSSG